MVSRTSDWRDELGRWLKPFLDRLGHKARRQMCPLYVSGPIVTSVEEFIYGDINGALLGLAVAMLPQGFGA
jgi:hypothetical protein